MKLDEIKLEKEKMRQDLNAQRIIHQKRNKSMQMLFIEKMTIFKRIVLLDRKQVSYANMMTELNTVKSKFTMRDIIEITDELYTGFSVKLKRFCPHVELSEREIGICCLIVGGFSNCDLAQLIYQKMDTQAIQKWKLRFSKKIGLPKRENLYSFLMEKIANDE
ncbi:MAG: hypothetical protein LBE56_05220 [Tannerella sp.]|jgi:ATP/maltotriose-dependent transcriptional regulator MalT|nr:hypothetical protein [Tannerella sp.]